MGQANFNKTQVIFILGLLTAIGPFSIDMYLPAFPTLATSLNTTIDKVMLSLSSFFIGISAGQLVYGPVLERYGRKKPLYFGLSIYLVASIGCAFANSVNSLIVLRFLQAIGSCAGMVSSRAIVRDLFEVKENAKVFSSLMLVVAVSPIIAPTLGGFISSELGWRYIFAALVLVAIIILLCVHFFLPESKQPDPTHSLKPKAIAINFYTILIQPQFYVFAFSGAIAASGLYAYISGSPQVFIGIFQVTEKQYGWIFAFIAMGIIGSSQLNTLALRNFSSETIVHAALLTQTLIGGTLVIASVTAWLNLWVAIILIFLYLSCQGFIFPNASALTLASFGHNAGNASALMGAVQMGIGAVASACVSIFQNNTAIPMASVMAICSVVAVLIFVFGRKIIMRKLSPEELEEENIELVNRM